ncbi:GtrA family protein [Variovorax atrisoli]|uniref:GtrA family protein n=1 Tax=Variovorax atrisoli TaxID=3394203 RepID=UPI00160AC38C|nr:GtrA family protein [Variovorax sp. BK613]MBB3639059.1 putative flippase GtrA [Variovorax sp. BK613]
MKREVLQVVRYGINGLAATAVHYGVLTFNLKVLHFSSAGAANMVAALFGIATSFLGSRYFVFSRTGHSVVYEALKFSGLYGVIALLHGAVLFVWSDIYSGDFRIGFLLATALQITLSFWGNKYLVFKK